MTCWSDVSPRVSLLIPLLWPTMYLLAFAAFQMECTKRLGHNFSFELVNSPSRKTKSSRIKQFLGVWKVLDSLVILFLSNFSTFLTLGAILTTIAFTHAKELFTSDDYQHYILSSVIGQFFGRSAISLLLVKKPEIRSLPFQTAGTVFVVFFMFLSFFASWNRFVHDIWSLFVLCIFQGIALGIVSTVSYHHISRGAHPHHIELLLITASLWESFGMLCAGLLGLHTEPSLYKHCYENNALGHCLTRVIDPAFWLNGK